MNVIKIELIECIDYLNKILRLVNEVEKNKCEIESLAGYVEGLIYGLENRININ